MKYPINYYYRNCTNALKANRYPFLILLLIILTIFMSLECVSHVTTPTRKPEKNFLVQKKSQPIIVLIYHHVFNSNSYTGQVDRMDVPITEFEIQMKYLKQNGYYTATTQDIYDFIYKNKKLPPKTVFITFDDGYVSNYYNVFPILKKYSVRATIFIVGSKIRNKDVTDSALINRVDRMPSLSWSQIKIMKSSHLVEFGGHTFDLHKQYNYQSILRNTKEEVILDDFNKEATVFKANHLPSPISIAYPYGQFNDMVIKASKKAGYKLGFTTKKGVVLQTADPYRIKRITIKTGTDIERFKTIINVKNWFQIF